MPDKNILLLARMVRQFEQCETKEILTSVSSTSESPSQIGTTLEYAHSL